MFSPALLSDGSCVVSAYFYVPSCMSAGSSPPCAAGVYGAGGAGALGRAAAAGVAVALHAAGGAGESRARGRGGRVQG